MKDKTEEERIYIIMNKKTVFVTGATSGVGLKITELLLKEGHRVFATGRNEVALLTLQRLGAEVLKADLTKMEDIEKVCNVLPSIDVAILCAGVGKFGIATELRDYDIQQMIEMNVAAPILMAKRLGQKMIERQKGHLIFVGSQAGKVATPKASVYAATKHAIVGFTNGLRMELEPYNIKVTAIHPGPIDTPFLDKADDSKMYRTSVKSFLLKSDEVAKATIRAIDKPVREINLPRYMAISSKLYAVAPALFEKVGKRFFNKK